MIKTLTEFRSDKGVIQRIEAQASIEKYKIDRSESGFGSYASLTQEEIRQSAKNSRQVHKVTAW